MQIIRILSLYTHLAQFSMLWFSTLPIWMSMYEMFILVLGLRTSLSQLVRATAPGAGHCLEAALRLSRRRESALKAHHRCCLSFALSLFLSCAGIFRCKLHCSLTPTRRLDVNPRVGGAERVGRNTARERERRPERSHTVKYTFMMTYWGILIGNTMFFSPHEQHACIQYNMHVFLWWPCSYM